MTIQGIAIDIATQTAQKDAEYGHATKKVAEIAAILYPEGIPTTEDALLVIRTLDKLCRIANGHLEDSWEDVAGYGLIGASNNT